MRTILLGSLALLLAGAGTSLADPNLVANQPAEQPIVEAPPTVAMADCCLPCEACRRSWVSAEYLLWWISDGPNPTPLVTTGNPLVDDDAGILGGTTTRVVLGASDLDYDPMSGARITAGRWLGAEQLLGVEVSGFVLAETSADGSVATGPLGVPSLLLPFQSLLGQERAFLIGFGGGGSEVVPGAASLHSTSQLCGVEVSALLNLARARRWQLDGLIGFAYRNLEEELRFDTLTNSLTPNEVFVATTSDQFATDNDFYGAMLGIRGEWSSGRLGVRGQAKIGLGCTEQEVRISGLSTFQGFGPVAGVLPPVSPFGAFAQPSNIGAASRNEFSVIPKLQVQVHYQLTGRLRVFAGYDVLYWGNVVRPGDQIDRVINTAALNNDFLLIALSGPTPALGGRPAPLFRDSDVWVQGVSFGAEFRY